MTVTQLECFLEAAKQGSFSIAAANLYLSQPTISRQIHALENELRTTLFFRANNTVRLTPLGQASYLKLEKLYQVFRKTSAEIHEMVDRCSGMLRIGIQAGLQIDPILRQSIQETKATHPNATIQVCHMTLKDSYSALMGGSIDVIFGLNATMPPSDKVHRFTLYEDRMCLAVPKDHSNAGLPSISHNEITEKFEGLHYFLVDAGEFEPSLQSDLKMAIDSYDSEELIKVSGPFAEPDTMMRMADAGLGVTCVNESCILKNSENTRLIPLVELTPEGAVEKTICVEAYWVNKNENSMITSFLDTLRQVQARHRT